MFVWHVFQSQHVFKICSFHIPSRQSFTMLSSWRRPLSHPRFRKAQCINSFHHISPIFTHPKIENNEKYGSCVTVTGRSAATFRFHAAYGVQNNFSRTSYGQKCSYSSSDFSTRDLSSQSLVTATFESGIYAHELCKYLPFIAMSNSFNSSVCQWLSQTLHRFQSLPSDAWHLLLAMVRLSGAELVMPSDFRHGPPW